MNKKMTVVIVIVILAVLAGGGYVLFHKSKTPTSNTTSTSSSSSSTNTQQSSSIVQTKTSSGTGQYLADAGGNALYTYGSDTSGKSNCTGSCLYSWPIYSAASAPATLPANVTVITRSDGSKQYAYKGMPLYTFSSDSVGQVTGDNVGNFHVAKP